MNSFVSLLLSLITLPILGIILWHFPILLIAFIYPFPFLFVFLLAFYAKLLLGFRLRRKTLFALSNIILFAAIPFAVHYTRFDDTNFLLYGLFHLFLSIPFSRYFDQYAVKMYDRIDFLGQLIKLPHSEKQITTLSLLKSTFRISPFPSFSSDLELDPNELHAFLWNVPGKEFRLTYVEELAGIYLILENEQLVPIPESLLEEEPLTLLFKQYPNLILYGKLLLSPVTIGNQELSNYVVLDLIPKYKGNKAKPPLPWSDIQSICKIFALKKIGEVGAFKGEKLLGLLEKPPKCPKELSSVYIRPWKPSTPDYRILSLK